MFLVCDLLFVMMNSLLRRLLTLSADQSISDRWCAVGLSPASPTNRPLQERDDQRRYDEIIIFEGDKEIE
jgi:hypothetical protein